MALWREKKAKKKQQLERGAKLLEELIECCDGKSNPIKFFSANEICKATNNFSKTNCVPELNDECKWYSGKNENHHRLLIKKGHDGELNFWRDIAISSMVSGHKNFLKLVGCCYEFEGPVMVYHGVKKHYPLEPNLWEQPWTKRIKIAEDIAIALAYLHAAFPRPFVYRSLSLEYILLDEDGVAKLSDFSNCVSIPKGETFVQVDSIAGLYAYMEYNYAMNGVVSEETDVFAIGKLMQMLLIGKEGFYEKGNAPWLPNKVEVRRVDEIADPEMGEISEDELSQMEAFLMLSHRCVGLIGQVPTMVEAAKELKKIQRSLGTHVSSAPSGDTQVDSAQDISSADQST